MDLSATGVPADDAAGPLVRGFSLGRNPFEGVLDMRLDLARAAATRMEVYNVLGQRVSRTDLGMLPGGTHRLTWDGSSDRGRDAGSGLYWIKVRAGDRTFVRQVVRLK
jgi:flagellar hook assembly protein FlgD